MYQLGSSHQLPVEAVVLLKYNQETVDHHYNNREGNMPATTCRNCCKTLVWTCINATTRFAHISCSVVDGLFGVRGVTGVIFATADFSHRFPFLIC